ncbi:hypothetical protein DPSP01_005552 [Paraphaeosphaeria sporulosa]
MRLLKRSPNGGLELVPFSDNKNLPPYAILSHTWVEGQEVSYHELVAGMGKDKAGHDKLNFCVDIAHQDGLQYSWVDTCCIDKSTSVEVSTAINSMFRWYQRARKCYVYLSDVEVPNEVTDAQVYPISWEAAFRQSRWFMRGWTLQELLAPPTVEFFSKEGKQLGSRMSLEQEIHKITKIPVKVLRGQGLSEFSVEERISWAARRITTLEEDRVYCLLGICGVFLPLIYGEGEAYARLRLEEEIQRRQKGHGTEHVRDLTAPSPLPFPRNALFVGREDQLRSLERFIDSSTPYRMSVQGLGGCGKSALALELAYRTLIQDAGRPVFWVPAISRQSFELAFRDIGIRLRVPGITEDNVDIKQLVKDALSLDGAGHWVMIVDNADDLGVLANGTSVHAGSARLQDHLPHNDKGKILFTTRSRKAAEELTPSHVLQLDDISKTEARQLLARRISKPRLLDEEKAADQLLESLEYLPLAVVQAAAFINSNDVPVSEYLSLFWATGTRTELFGEHFEDPSRYKEMESTVARTWHISFDQIQRQDRLAAECLSFMACIDRINVPRSLLPRGGSVLQQTKAIGTLKGYAFVTERQQASQEPGSEKCFDMHRLVHMASVWWLDRHGEGPAWTARAAARLEELLPRGGHVRKEVWTGYLAHAIHVTRPDSVLEETAKASLLDRIGRCQSSLGQYSAAETVHRQALSLRKRKLGDKHTDTLTSMNYLAEALESQGKYEEGESMNRETLALREKVLGREHPDMLTSMSNLAFVLERQGKYEEAESMNQETLALREKVLGREHPDTLTSMGNLALVLERQGKYEEAESMNRETLALRENVLGWEHPSTLASMTNLAAVLGRQGKYDEAESMNRETLARYEKVLGREHPDTLTSMSILAVVLEHQGKYEEAESMNQETLALREKVLGPEHPSTLTSMYCLAHLLANQHRYTESRALYERACAAYTTLLGENHPTTHACRQHYREMITLQERDRSTLSSAMLTTDVADIPKKSKLSRGLMKIGIRSSKFSL